MNRFILAVVVRMASACLLFCFAVIPARAKEDVDWNKIELRATHVAGNVHMIDMVEGSEGFAGGNIGVLVSEKGLLMVDTMFAPLAPKVRAVLRALSDKPVKFVINTHVHGDHTDGDRVFGSDSIIVAHTKTRAQLLVSEPEADEEPFPPEALPIVTVDRALTLHQSGEVVRILHFPNAHSDTDLVVIFKDAKVVHMGDVYFAGMFPFIGRGGSVNGLIAAIEKILSEVPADAKIIPGHGPLSDTAGLRDTLAMLKATSNIVAAGIRKGETAGQMKARNAFAGYERWSHGYMNGDQFLDQLYRVMTKQ